MTQSLCHAAVSPTSLLCHVQLLFNYGMVIKSYSTAFADISKKCILKQLLLYYHQCIPQSNMAFIKKIHGWCCLQLVHSELGLSACLLYYRLLSLFYLSNLVLLHSRQAPFSIQHRTKDHQPFEKHAESSTLDTRISKINVSRYLKACHITVQ